MVNVRLGEKIRRWWSNRSSVTGRYVSKGYAEKHPDTTVREVHRPEDERLARPDDEVQ
jgi:hypothetical protein